VLAVVLFDQVGAAARFNRRDLAIFGSQVDRAWFELLRKLNGMKF
jgi:hypothetical protein